MCVCVCVCVYACIIVSLVFDSYKYTVFSLFNIFWVLSCSIRDVLLSWHGAFVGAKCMWFGN